MRFFVMSETVAPLIWKLATWGQRLPLPTGRLREPTGSSSMVLYTNYNPRSIVGKGGVGKKKEASVITSKETGSNENEHIFKSVSQRRLS